MLKLGYAGQIQARRLGETVLGQAKYDAPRLGKANRDDEKHEGFIRAQIGRRRHAVAMSADS